MDIDLILNTIEENGYLGLYFTLWLGIFGMPIPNEVIITTIGFAASQNVLNPITMFLVTYCGILSALTTCYLLGRFIGRPILAFFEKRKRFSKKIKKSLKLIERYHAFSLSLSYFLPGVRNFVPFMYGVSRLPFKTFIVFSYLGAFFWLMIMFSAGFWFNEYLEPILLFGKELLAGIAGISILVLFIKMIYKKKNKNIKTVKDQGGLL